jgi:DNA-directed RNA polymerase
LRTIARALALQGHVLKWDTPTGFPFSNRYHHPATKRVKLILSGLSFKRKIAIGHKSKVDVKRAVNAVAPNLIHALDAAHLARTVNACYSAGIKDMVTVHDCFSCLAPHAADLNQIVRDEFIRMYAECDPLTEIRERATSALTGLAPKLIPCVPAPGSFDLAQISKSAFAFS